MDPFVTGSLPSSGRMLESQLTPVSILVLRRRVEGELEYSITNVGRFTEESLVNPLYH